MKITMKLLPWSGLGMISDGRNIPDDHRAWSTKDDMGRTVIDN